MWKKSVKMIQSQLQSLFHSSATNQTTFAVSSRRRDTSAKEILSESQVWIDSMAITEIEEDPNV